MRWLKWIFAYLFDCVHPHTTWPHRNRSGFAYVCCVDCGKELPYSLELMRIVSPDGHEFRNPLSRHWPANASLLLLCFAMLALLHPSRAFAQISDNQALRMQPAVPTFAGPAPTLVIGFVGGRVHSDDPRHSEVQLAQRLQKQYGDGVVAEVFRNRDRAKAYQAITQWRNDLENEGSQEPRVILFGHSWGASAAVYLARDLDRAGIPVALTIQVDSVRKHGQDDSVIPTNVEAAVNFYQTKGLIHGRSEVVAADPSHTAVLGNFRLDYEKEPAECRAYPWYNRFFFKGHTSIECDPRVWSEVQTLIETRLTSPRRVAQTELAAQLAR